MKPVIFVSIYDSKEAALKRVELSMALDMLATKWEVKYTGKQYAVYVTTMSAE